MIKNKDMNRIVLLFFTLLLCNIVAVIVHASPINLLEAKNTKKVSIKAIGNGGYIGECISLTVKNITQIKQDIEVSPGIIFTCQDSSSQNLMVVEQYSLALMPGATRTLNIQTMCIQARNHSPSSGVLFAMNKEATGHLSALAELIATRNYQNSTAQSAVWALTDGNEINEIYASDTTMAGELATFVSKATGKPRAKFIIPKEHYIYAIKMNMVHHFSKATKITLACYDSTGRIVKEYYKNRLIPIGTYIATFGINKVADKGTKFIYRISDDKGTVIKERIITESINEPKAEKWKLDISFDYILDKPISAATMSLYDGKGVLMEDLYTNRSLPAGGRRQSYSFHHAYGKNAKLVIRLKDATGKIIVEQKVDASKSVKVPW